VVIITDVKENDLNEVYDVELESFDKPYPFSLLRAYYFISKGLFLVAKEGEEVIGYSLGIVQFGYRGHVVSIAVRKDKRNNGVGSLLLSELENRFKRMNCLHSYLEVYFKNYPAINFYNKMGYKVIKIVKNYYGKEKHAFVMMKYLYDFPAFE
jgi:ribosomal-protein-alanine N-acetyltransferase